MISFSISQYFTVTPSSPERLKTAAQRPGGRLTLMHILINFNV